MNFSDAIYEVLDHFLSHLEEKSRIQVLYDLREKVNERYQYECSDPMEELSKELLSLEDLEKDDVKILTDIYELLKAKEWVKAARKFEKADTIIREHMPKKTYHWMYLNFQQTRD